MTTARPVRWQIMSPPWKKENLLSYFDPSPEASKPSNDSSDSGGTEEDSIDYDKESSVDFSGDECVSRRDCVQQNEEYGHENSCHSDDDVLSIGLSLSPLDVDDGDELMADESSPSNQETNRLRDDAITRSTDDAQRLNTPENASNQNNNFVSGTELNPELRGDRLTDVNKNITNEACNLANSEPDVVRPMTATGNFDRFDNSELNLGLAEDELSDIGLGDLDLSNDEFNYEGFGARLEIDELNYRQLVNPELNNVVFNGDDQTQFCNMQLNFSLLNSFENATRQSNSVQNNESLNRDQLDIFRLDKGLPHSTAINNSSNKEQYNFERESVTVRNDCSKVTFRIVQGNRLNINHRRDRELYRNSLRNVERKKGRKQKKKLPVSTSAGQGEGEVIGDEPSAETDNGHEIQGNTVTTGEQEALAESDIGRYFMLHKKESLCLS